MKETLFFYRSEIHCLLALDDRSNEWMCFVGFEKNHKLFTVGFHKAKRAALTRYKHINQIAGNSVWKSLNWLGCCEHPFSKEKTMQLLQNLADELGTKEEEIVEEESIEEEEFDDDIQAILDLVKI